MQKHIIQLQLLVIAVLISLNFTTSTLGNFAPKDTVNLSGKYVGGWTSTTPGNQYDSIPISAILSKSDEDGIYTGEFFFTGVHYSCCNSGKNDGTISLKTDGSQIINFEYSDILPKCHGYFSGNGIIDSIGTLLIEFKGYDCEGKHKGSSLSLSKQI